MPNVCCADELWRGVLTDKKEGRSCELLAPLFSWGLLHFLPLLICCWQLFSHLWRVTAPHWERHCNYCAVWFVRTQINTLCTRRWCTPRHKHRHGWTKERPCVGMLLHSLSTLSLLRCGSRQRGHSCGAGGPLYPQTGACRHKENKPGKMPDQHGWAVGEFNKCLVFVLILLQPPKEFVINGINQ